MPFDPQSYRRWYESDLGRRVEADEKRVVFELAQLRSGERVLDIGCGDGVFTEEARRRTGLVVGLDHAADMLAAAETRLGASPSLAWVRGEADALPFPNASFEAVLAITLLGLTARPERVVAEAFRVLKPGGRILLGELNRYSVWALRRRLKGLLKPSDIWAQARFFSAAEVGAMLRNGGFVVTACRGAVCYPPLKNRLLLQAAPILERLAPRYGASFGAFLAVRGEKPPR